MVSRRITRNEVEQVLLNGRIIAEYPTDKPFPSKLLLGTVVGQPLHVVASQDEAGCCFIITVHEPDPVVWNVDFSLKK